MVHELTQQDQTLPRSYLVKGCQGTIDSRWNIRKAPGDQPGAELPLEDLLPHQADNKGKVPSERKSIHLDALLTTVRSLGITLNVWKPKESGKKVEWTSLLGGEKRLLLKKLPCHFSKLLPPERAPVVQKLKAFPLQKVFRL